MKLNKLALGLLACMPLMACSSTDDTMVVDNAEMADLTEARLPEVRYYVIADT